MKIRTYVLSVFALVLFTYAGTEKAGLTEGNRPGDIAPGIGSLKTDVDITFSTGSGSYTLLHFWAAYDAGSRMLNVQLWNRLMQEDLSGVKMISVSLDEPESIFTETVKADRLEATNQVHEMLGEHSEVYKKYGLKKGLRNFLIDNKGVIVATNITPQKLSKFINKQKN
jgi:hypothetical protein